MSFVAVLCDGLLLVALHVTVGERRHEAYDRIFLLCRVSFDGRFISFATFDDEQLAGIAIRDAP